MNVKLKQALAFIIQLGIELKKKKKLNLHNLFFVDW